jgi:hypothetical protein
MIYGRYKAACGQVWNSECTASAGQGIQNKQINELAEQCLNDRILFSQKCCNGKYDRGHCMPITRMRNIIHKCKNFPRLEQIVSKPIVVYPSPPTAGDVTSGTKAVHVIDQDRKNLLLTLQTDKVKRLIANGWKFKAMVNINDYKEEPNVISVNILNSDKILLLKN